MAHNWIAYDTTLAMAEYVAESEGWIASEDELSELFDAEIAPFVIEQYGEDDVTAMNESFNDWTDTLCSDGELHESQYNAYCYVGKWSN